MNCVAPTSLTKTLTSELHLSALGLRGQKANEKNALQMGKIALRGWEMHVAKVVRVDEFDPSFLFDLLTRFCFQKCGSQPQPNKLGQAMHCQNCNVKENPKGVCNSLYLIKYC